MSLKSFVQDKHTLEEVFEYISKYTDAYALKQMYSGEDVSGIKNAHEIIKRAKQSMIAEFGETTVNKKPDRAL